MPSFPCSLQAAALAFQAAGQIFGQGTVDLKKIPLRKRAMQHLTIHKLNLRVKGWPFVLGPKRGFVPVAQVISRDRKTSLSPASAKFPMFFASSCTGFPGGRPDIWPRNCRSEKDPTEKKSYATSDYPSLTHCLAKIKSLQEHATQHC